MKMLLSLILVLMLNGCASLYVSSIVNPGVQPHVRKEMVKNEKERRIKTKAIDKGHKEQRIRIQKAQKQPWK